ncbi:ornithine decarboxylase, partial [Danaus plexippus plexippus]
EHRVSPAQVAVPRATPLAPRALTLVDWPALTHLTPAPHHNRTMKVTEQHVTVMKGPWSPASVARDTVDRGHEEPFYVMDLGEVVQRYNTWKELMPRVEPFYAVKCNDDRLLVSTLAALGAGFDCASKAEIELVTSLGVTPDRIIFANPAKLSSHIRYAREAGVTVLTVDSDTELVKIKQHMPDAELVVRIRCDAASAQCPLGIKFGCDPLLEAPRLLKLAAVLGLNVVGISFHAGSGAGESAVYSRGIRLARALFEAGDAAGHRMSLLDLGGGFPGHHGSSIREVSEVISEALATYFPSGGVRVIAEPGRYFAAAAYTLFTLVHAKRQLPADGEEDPHTMYFINDGVYGSFNCVLYDHQVVTPELLQESTGAPQTCSIWGPSCDGLDCVIESCLLPPLAVGSWLEWRNMGAYTIPIASPFNGFPVPTVKPVLDYRLWVLLRDMWSSTGAVFSHSCPPPSSPVDSSPSPSLSLSPSPSPEGWARGNDLCELPNC